MVVLLSWLLLFGTSPLSHAAEMGVYLLPLECSELLPDNTPFLQFFEAVARANLRKDKNLSQRLFRVLALRNKMQEISDQSREQNPVDLLIRKSLCFYREKKEPLKMVPFDDPTLTDFLRKSLSDLERNVEKVILERVQAKQQRKEYERLLGENQELEERVKTQAEAAADKEFERLSKAARKNLKERKK